VDDLSDRFLEEFQPTHPRNKVADYPHYFLGSIIISKKDTIGNIVDGQQRLTSLTLLLVLLRNLQKGQAKQVNVDELIFSERFDKKSFNLHVDERIAAMEALYEGLSFDVTDCHESVQNLVQRYRDLETCFPDELHGVALPYFIDWLLENVHLVEITAYSDDDAYTIFETMNDRGLSLSPTEMLKGYLLANIDENRRTAANTRWRDRIRELNNAGKEVEPDCFKAWLRSQHATKIRERKKGAKPEDFDRIGTEFHRWLRAAAATVGLHQSDDFYRFIDRDFAFYSRQYLRLLEASGKPVAGMEHVLYNSQNGFTLQYMLLLAPLRPDDSEPEVVHKIGLVARYLDILLTWRLWNFRSIAYSTMQYSMFVVMRDIRGLASDALAHKLYEFLGKEGETFASNDRLRIHQQNRYAIHRMLARLTAAPTVLRPQPRLPPLQRTERAALHPATRVQKGRPRKPQSALPSDCRTDLESFRPAELTWGTATRSRSWLASIARRHLPEAESAAVRSGYDQSCHSSILIAVPRARVRKATTYIKRIAAGMCRRASAHSGSPR